MDGGKISFTFSDGGGHGVLVAQKSPPGVIADESVSLEVEGGLDIHNGIIGGLPKDCVLLNGIIKLVEEHLKPSDGLVALAKVHINTEDFPEGLVNNPSGLEAVLVLQLHHSGQGHPVKDPILGNLQRIKKTEIQRKKGERNEREMKKEMKKETMIEITDALTWK